MKLLTIEEINTLCGEVWGVPQDSRLCNQAKLAIDLAEENQRLRLALEKISKCGCHSPECDFYPDPYPWDIAKQALEGGKK